MDRKTAHLHLLADHSLLQRIDDWGWEKRIRTRAEVLRQLIEKGLDAEKRNNAVAHQASN